MLNLFGVIGDFAIALATIALTGVGVVLANSYVRRMRFELAEARRTAYSALWAVTGRAAPTRLDTAGSRGCLESGERWALYQDMTSWYYRDGNGMLLEPATRNVYLNAKHNLVCAEDQIRPSEAWTAIKDDLRRSGAKLDDDDVRGVLSIRQLSLLRTQLKTDLAIYGQIYTTALAQHEREFLKECNIDSDTRPWRAAFASERAENVSPIV